MIRSRQKRAFFLLSLTVLAALGVADSAFAAPHGAAAIAPQTTLRNWGLDNAFKSHIDVKRAWKLSEGSREVVVAVIDTGIDPNHLALRDNLWRKPGSKKLEYGWDFVKRKANPVDVAGHGTHIAGIIGAAFDRERGIVGVAPKVSIMALRFYAEESTDDEVIENTAKAVDYAIANGAHIINYSAGGKTFSEREKRAFERARARGILVVAAAGNKHQDTDKANFKFYPASYGFDNIIAVAATDIDDELLASSNWGVNTVHVSAPGENIFSTLPGGRYGYLTGTSQSAAFVTGVAALLMAKDPSLRGNPDRVKALILENADKVQKLDAKVASGGRVNAYAALNAAVKRISGSELSRRHELGPQDRAPAKLSDF